MRRDHESAFLALEIREIVERVDAVGAVREIQQQHVLPGDRPLDTRNQDDAALRRVGFERTQIELMFVKRDRDRVVPERRRAVDEVGRAMRNPVYWIVGCMGMQVDFEHLAFARYQFPCRARQRRP